MNRTITSFIAAAAVSMTLPAFAQQSSSTTADKDEVRLTGCVEKNKSGGYWLMTRDAAENSPAPTGTSGAATTADKTASGAPGNRYWNLENAKDIEKYVNQTVQVTGRPKDSTSRDEVKGTSGPEIKVRDFHVKAVEPVVGTCR
jgi:hypothetical protein